MKVGGLVKQEWQFELSSTLIETKRNLFKVDNSARNSIRVHESWWLNESERVEIS